MVPARNLARAIHSVGARTSPRRIEIAMKRSYLARAAAAALFAVLAACSGPGVDLAAWRAASMTPRAVAERGDLASELATVESTRRADELAKARQLALTLAAEHPDDARVLVVASRAESDEMLLLPADDKSARNNAAASALDFAERATERGANDAASLAQLAWALGTTTHLQPMFDRAAHARRTMETAHASLELDAKEPTATATLAIVHLRLETLPWIASVMAFGAPESSLKDAERFARAACESAASRENRLILAKVLIAANRRADARAELEQGLAAPERFPRDHALAQPMRDLLATLD